MADPHSTPTPETNALITGHKGTASLGELAGHYNALLDHARKLERERDAARAALVDMDIIGRRENKDPSRREWWSGGTWLYRNQVVAVVELAAAPSSTDAQADQEQGAPRMRFTPEQPASSVPLTEEGRWAVFCAICKCQWSVPYRHPGKSVCDDCEKRAIAGLRAKKGTP